MKKLMFLAVVAAATVASANVCVTTKGHWEKTECGKEWVEGTEGAGTAHKVAITLKTTGIASSSKTKKVQCEEDEVTCTYWRAQATKKIDGMIWEQLDDCGDCVLIGTKSALWTKTAPVDAEMTLAIGKIGKGVNSKSIEAVGTIVGEEFGALTFAGFGTLTSKTTKIQCEEDACAAWVKSISGGIAGALVAPEYANNCQECDPIEYAGCCEDIQLAEVTAAYGTFKITYDAATAKKVAVAEDDEAVIAAKMPKAIADDIVVNEVAIEE